MRVSVITVDKVICNFLTILPYISEPIHQENVFVFHLVLYSTTPLVDEERTEWHGRMRVSIELGGTWKKAVVVTFRIICKYLSGDSEDNHREPVRTVAVLTEN
jgi:hypothetical protein